MPTFEIEQYELHTQKFRVEAKDEAEAIARLLDGEADALDNGLEYIEVVDDRGLMAIEHEKLARRLRKLGVSVEDRIPSIRSIEQVD